MLGLIYKDLMVMKKDLSLCAVALIFFSFPLFLPWDALLKANQADTEIMNAQTMTYSIMPLFTYFCCFVVISIIQGSIFSHDERTVYGSYVMSTPLGSRGQVLSKYYLTLALSFCVVLWGFICDTISMCISGIRGSASVIYASMFFIQITLRAFELPFLIRYGQKHGKTYKILFLSAIAFAVIVYLLFGKLPQHMSLDRFFEFLYRLSQHTATLSTVFLGLISLFPYVALLLYYISYQISCRLYRKGVFCYDN